jgi:hypothetical protein
MSVSGPLTLSIFFLGNKRNGEEGFFFTEGSKAAEDLENLLMVIV